ncbi:MAG: serine protease [Chitinophagaceae bacterium]
MDNKVHGLGFALTNDGYVITNYHVTEGADSVYIQTRNGEYLKASTISFDAKSDIAILKVESRKFRFNKQQSALPYTFATAKKSLGERVFTLGYPQDEIVYSEGYVSSRNGFSGRFHAVPPGITGRAGPKRSSRNGCLR